MRLTILIMLAALSALAIQPVHAAAAADCEMTPTERAWLERVLKASDYVMSQRLGIPDDWDTDIVVFNERCRFEAKASLTPRWAGVRHDGKIRMPDGSDGDVQVTSFAWRGEDSGKRVFVMALPSIWEAAKVIKPGDADGLGGIFIHEFSHTRHMPAVEPYFEAARARYEMPDDLDDDSLQRHFADDPAYIAAIGKEIDLLYRAAEEPDAATAKAFAREALRLMEARQSRWFRGADSRWKPYDDIFLTLEGFGQWSGYAWLSDPRGGGMTPSVALEKMRGSKRWWSQEEGLALFLVIDRFVPGWGALAFGTPALLGIDLLRKAAGVEAAYVSSAAATSATPGNANQALENQTLREPLPPLAGAARRQG